MPLSKEELRLLEQMERALTEEDPKFAATLRGVTLQRIQQRHTVLAGVVLLAGASLTMVAVITGLWALGVIGFMVMVVAGCLGVEALRGRTHPFTMSDLRFSRMGMARALRGGRSRRRRGL